MATGRIDSMGSLIDGRVGVVSPIVRGSLRTVTDAAVDNTVRLPARMCVNRAAGLGIAR